jgi:hypothetical protein
MYEKELVKQEEAAALASKKAALENMRITAKTVARARAFSRDFPNCNVIRVMFESVDNNQDGTSRACVRPL